MREIQYVCIYYGIICIFIINQIFQYQLDFNNKIFSTFLIIIGMFIGFVLQTLAEYSIHYMFHNFSYYIEKYLFLNENFNIYNHNSHHEKPEDEEEFVYTIFETSRIIIPFLVVVGYFLHLWKFKTPTLQIVFLYFSCFIFWFIFFWTLINSLKYILKCY